MRNRIGTLIGAALFLIAFVVYLRTTSPTTAFWDPGEFNTAANILGVPHPPGYPLLTLMGRVAVTVLAPLGRTVAWRVDFLSSVVSSITVLLIFLLVVKLIKRWKGEPRDWLDELSLYGAGAVASICIAFAYTFWFNAIESTPFATAHMLMTLTLYLILRWQDRLSQKGMRRILLLITYIWGAGVGIHLGVIQVFPAILLFIFLVRWRDFLEPKFLALAVLLFFLGLTVHAHLVIRAHIDPAINECEPRDWSSLMYVLERKQYEPFNWHLRRADFWPYQFGHMFVRYFLWQWNVSASPLPGAIGDLVYSSGSKANYAKMWTPAAVRFLPAVPALLLTLAIYGLGILGISTHIRMEKKGGLIFGLAWLWGFLCLGALPSLGLPPTIGVILGMAGFLLALIFAFRRTEGEAKTFPLLSAAFFLASVAFVFYNNMIDPQVRDRDYVFSPAFILFSIWIGIGAWQALTFLREKLKAWERYAVPAGAVILVLLSFQPMLTYFHINDRSGNWIPFEYARNILESCEKDAIIFTNGDNDTFPLWYAQWVEGVRQDVRVANLSLINTNWYIKQLKRGHDPDNIGWYRRTFGWLNIFKSGQRPVSPPAPLNLSEELIDKLMPFQTQDGRVFYVATVAVKDIIAANAGKTGGGKGLLPTVDILPPAQYQEKVFGQPYHEKFPIYFSVTVQEDNLMDLQPNLRMEGFVYRVVPENTWNKQPDVERTERNLYQKYSYTSVYDPKVFKDENTSNLLRNYASSHFQMGVAYRKLNQPEKALMEFEEAAKIAPDEPANLNLLGVTYAELGRYPQSLDNFRKLLAVEPNHPYGYEQLGRILLAMGMKDSAEAYLAKGMAADPNYPGTYLQLYQLYRSEKDTARAIHILDTWRRAHPYDSTVIQEMEQYRKEIASGKRETMVVKLPTLPVQIR